ncbi:uncharacterized protein [Parasteatoda tepidariorum]|nr:uncharacterized protein LOC107451239 isoform X2 [Parasteatoda tepidariorum]
MWKKAIPRADRMLRPTDFVCELHFKKEEILKYFETKLPNGVIHRILRGRKGLVPGAIPSIFPNVPGHSTFVENRATKLKEKIVKRKKISCPKKKNETKKKNDSSHQTGKENILMEVIVVQPLPENSAATQPSHLRENQNVKVANSSLSILEKHTRPESDAPASCLFFDAIAVNSRQNVCNKILTEFPSADKLTKNYNEQNSSVTNVTESYVPDALTDNYSKQNSTDRTITVSFVPDIQTENYSKQSSSDKTIIESSVPDILTENYSEQNSLDKSIVESPVPDALIENYSEENSADGTKIVSSVPDIRTENYSKQNSSDRTVTESSVPDALADHSTCEVIMTEYPTYDTHPDDLSDQSNDNVTSAKPTVSDADRIICDKIRAKISKILSEPDIEEQVSFDFIKANLDMFETTDSWWRVNAFNNFIVFSRWNSDYAVDRRIVITKDLAVKVFLMDRETTIGRDMEKFSIYDIAKLIYRVENLKLCSGIDKKDRNCAGFLQSVFMCKRHNLCLDCIKWRKEEAKEAVKRLKESPNCIELLNFNLIT